MSISWCRPWKPGSGNPGSGNLDRETLDRETLDRETWIAADRSALADYYGHRFLASALPVAEDLEAIPEDSIQTALTRATLPTQKRAYHKTRHAPDLLRRIDPVLVRKRCRMCDRLFEVMGGLIRAA